MAGGRHRAWSTAFKTFAGRLKSPRVNACTEEILTPKLRLDAELPMEDVSLSLLEAQELLEPYGTGNSQPIFAAADGDAGRVRHGVLKEKHLQVGLSRRDAGSCKRSISAAPRSTAAPAPWDVAFTVERNEFNGRVDAQMQIVAIRSADFRDVKRASAGIRISS